MDESALDPGAKTREKNLSGLRVVTFESRRAKEIAEMLGRYGAEAVSAPALRESPLDDSPPAREFLTRLLAGEIDIVILMTGVGTRALVRAIEPTCSVRRFVEALTATLTIARGPKPVAALRELGLTSALTVPEPNTWREILTETAAVVDLRGRRVAIQEYGVPNEDLVEALENKGATVLRVPVYRWTLPEDTGPLRSAAMDLVNGDLDIALFTSASQVTHLFEIAREVGVAERLVAASRNVLIASIGPVCSDSLRRRGIVPDIEPARGKMGQLVREVAERGKRALEEKRAGRSDKSR